MLPWIGLVAKVILQRGLRLSRYRRTLRVGPVLDREHCGLDARGEVELRQDMAHVQLDRVVADVERARDRLVRHALRQVIEDLTLAFGELPEQMFLGLVLPSRLQQV